MSWTKRLMYQKALDFAEEKHKGQFDDEGKDYFQAHIMPIYRILTHLKCNKETVIAAILHDTIEDTDTTYKEIKTLFGNVVADLVNEVTHEGDKSTGFYFPRLQSKEAIIIKFADRLSNLTRMDAWNYERQQHFLKRSKFWKSDSSQPKIQGDEKI